MKTQDTTPAARPAIASRQCPICGTRFNPARRSQRACSNPCKQALLRTENRIGKGPKTPPGLGQYQTPQKPQFAASQVTENIEGRDTVLDDLSEPTPLTFERINEITWKLTDGVKIRHAGGTYVHGSDQTRALAWLMDIGWGADRQAWVIRMADKSFGPVTFGKAKAAAILMAQGGFEQIVTRLLNPIRYLNLQQVQLMAGEAR